MGKTEAIKIADEILTLYKMYGDQDYIGEPVSQIEHMCQCAQLAKNEPVPGTGHPCNGGSKR
jgi:predicted HD phosphohydrolase